MEINFAKCSDVYGILKVQNELLIKNLKAGDKKKNGFLVYSINKEQLLKVLENYENIILCAIEKKKIVGYILSYPLDEWIKIKKYWLERLGIIPSKFKILKKEKLIYLRHIGRDILSKGAGEKLLNFFIKECKKRNFKYIICEILERPIKNETSLNFFVNKFAFQRIGKIKYEDKTTWGVYLYKL